VFSKMLKPESPCLISGGEFVTLGKSVGRGDDLVRPVVFRVEIHHVQPSPSNKLIDLTRSASSERQLSPTVKLNPLKSSGRYGLNDTSSSSSDEMSSSYMNDNSSDIEDNPGTPPEDRCAPLLDSTHSSSHLGHALEVLRGLVPPVHPPVPQRSQSTSREHSPFPPFYLPPLIQSSDKASDISDWNKLYADELDEVNKSRSNSPMDLASPSPDPSDFNHVSTSEPNVVGAWPNSPRSVSSLYVECRTTTPLADEASNAPVQMPREESSVPIAPQKHVADSNMAYDTCPLQELFTLRETEVTTLKASLNDLKADVSNLRLRQDETKLHVSAEVGGLAGKLTDLENRFKNLEASVVDAEQISGVNAMDVQMDIMGLQGGLSKLQDDFKSFMEVVEVQRKEVESLGDRQDVKDSINTLHQLVAEMKTLCDKTHQRVNTELDNVKAARLKAMVSVQELVAKSAQSLNPAPKSLKRKRDDADDNGEAGQEDICDLADTASAGSTTRLGADGIAVPVRKRKRGIASKLFRTATAVTLGAIVTWSALAYS